MKFLSAVLFPTAFAGMAFLSPVHAATVEVSYDLELAYHSEHGIRSNTATAIRDFVGMDILATYTDGTTEVWDWVYTNPYSIWEAGTDHISNDLTIDVINGRFAINAVKSLASLAFDLVGANAIWDVGDYVDSDPRNSPTTKVGHEFRVRSGNSDALEGEIRASYSDRVQIGDHLTGEDAFTHLLVDFTGLADGGFTGDMTWSSDTDSLAFAGDLAPVVPAVPLPAGGLLLLTGLGALGLKRRAGKSAAA
ncbi:VPLPA-CTERM sorting domain-containing protein [Yoonia sp. F2084L]|nr:VPLPA-CTERM sorting domain-containing protein [Yoonia sp. F2084L]